MQATFKINADELSDRLLQAIKEMFKGKAVTITITSETDDSAYLTSNLANRKHLEDSMVSEPVIKFTGPEFEEHVRELIEKDK